MNALSLYRIMCPAHFSLPEVFLQVFSIHERTAVSGGARPTKRVISDVNWWVSDLHTSESDVKVFSLLKSFHLVPSSAPPIFVRGSKEITAHRNKIKKYISVSDGLPTSGSRVWQTTCLWPHIHLFGTWLHRRIHLSIHPEKCLKGGFRNPFNDFLVNKKKKKKIQKQEERNHNDCSWWLARPLIIVESQPTRRNKKMASPFLYRHK